MKQRKPVIGILVILVIVVAAVICVVSVRQKSSKVPNTDQNIAEYADSEKETEQNAAIDRSSEELAREVIRQIESQDGYAETAFWEPIAVIDDFNGDGTDEMLAVYEVENSVTFDVVYGLWRLESSGVSELRSDVLFTEVGGNGGIVGITEYDEVAYLAIVFDEPEGEYFSDYCLFLPWKAEDREPQFDDSYYMKWSGYYEETDQREYFVGDTAVGMDEFNEILGRFENWKYTLDLFAGPGDSYTKTFAELKSE